MLEHAPFTGNRENLRKLIEGAKWYAAKYPYQFNMGSFSVIEGRVNNCPVAVNAASHTCGTSACFAGIGPLVAGLEPIGTESWFAYINRVFGINNTDADDDAWEWLFGGGWAEHEVGGTIWHAIARAEYVLEHGVPEDSEDQKSNVTALSYLDYVKQPE